MNTKTISHVLLGTALLVLVMGCTQANSNGPPTGKTSNTTVSITANGYEPQSVSIPKGGTVTWPRKHSEK